MNPSLDPTTIDVFVSGHTHLPSFSKLERGRQAVRPGQPDASCASCSPSRRT